MGNMESLLSCVATLPFALSFDVVALVFVASVSYSTLNYSDKAHRRRQSINTNGAKAKSRLNRITSFEK